MEAMPEPNTRWHAAFWVLFLVALWALLHRYQGFARDGELYAMQAMSRLLPSLKTDLYLQFSGQDRFTLFSPIYALAIRALGLVGAATVLFCLCAAWLIGAVKLMAVRLVGTRESWLAAAAVLVVPGIYGPFGIFSYNEDYLTARSLSEALVTTALAAYFAEKRTGALLLMGAAMFIHPIMGLPGVLLLLCLLIGIKRSSQLAIAGTTVLAMLACAVRFSPAIAAHVTLIDGAWFEMVLERSQFLFIQHWDRFGYEATARPLVCLMLGSLVFQDERIRKLCAGAALVGIAGLAVNAIPSFISPISILLQGQSWRWMWVTGLVSVMLVPSMILRLVAEPRGGGFAAGMLLLGWTFSDVDGLAACVAALAVWCVRHQLTPRAVQILNWGVVAGVTLVVAATLANAWNLAHISNQDTIRDAGWSSLSRNIASLGLPAVGLLWAAWAWTSKRRSSTSNTLALGLALAIGVAFFPGSLRLASASGTEREIREFADWRELIPPTSNVMLLPPVKSAAFVWFTLQRPSYLTVDQSSGVVFSPDTSAEVRRRSDLLLPVSSPDWRIYSSIQHVKVPGSTPPAALTDRSLRQICVDPALGFVISRGDLETGMVSHRRNGTWKDWKLFDCQDVRKQDAG